MADKQPQNIVEGAAGDVEDERPAVKSAEDRKAASALANLDNTDDTSAASKNVDQEAVGQAMKNLGGSTDGSSLKRAPVSAAAPKKVVKIDATDVALLVQELELPKPKVTEMLKSCEGDVLAVMRAYVAPSF